MEKRDADAWSAIGRPKEHCSGCGAALEAAEEFFSVLATEEGTFRRRDLCAPCFLALPAKPTSFWKRTPKKAEGLAKAGAKGGRRGARARDLDALLELFDRLSDAEADGRGGDAPRGGGDLLTAEERAKLRYVLALALVRRKRLELVDLAREGGADCLILRATGDAELVTISAPRISEEDLARLSKEIDAEVGLS